MVDIITHENYSRNNTVFPCDLGDLTIISFIVAIVTFSVAICCANCFWLSRLRRKQRQKQRDETRNCKYVIYL